MEQNPLHHILEYNLDIGKTKPDTVHRDESYCPFCDVAHLKNIMDTKGHMIWLENAYPVLKDSWQTLIIETDDCDGDFSTYDAAYAVDLIRFGLFTGGTYLWEWKNNAENGASTNERYNLYPIPQTDMQANGGLTQNPGY